MFLIDYHDYNPNPFHLKVIDKSLLGYNVFVDRKDFENTITFLEIFTELFWNDNIYPESEILIELEKRMKESRPDVLVKGITDNDETLNWGGYTENPTTDK